MRFTFLMNFMFLFFAASNASEVENSQVSNINTKRNMIVGGTSVKDNPINYPWFTLVRMITASGAKSDCGGSLISSAYVLTSASCLTSTSIKTVEVFVGALTLDEDQEPSATLSAPFERIDHPHYNPNTLDYNFALIRLVKPVDAKVSPVKIDTSNIAGGYQDDTKNLWIAGFGDKDGVPQIQNIPKDLQHAQVQSVSNNDCADVFQIISKDVTSNMMCATSATDTEKQGLAIGDVGGPLYDAGSSTLVGVAAAESLSAGLIFPDRFGRVAAAAPWIHEKLCATDAVEHPDPKPHFCLDDKPKFAMPPMPTPTPTSTPTTPSPTSTPTTPSPTSTPTTPSPTSTPMIALPTLGVVDDPTKKKKSKKKKSKKKKSKDEITASVNKSQAQIDTSSKLDWKVIAGPCVVVGVVALILYMVFVVIYNRRNSSSDRASDKDRLWTGDQSDSRLGEKKVAFPVAKVIDEEEWEKFQALSPGDVDEMNWKRKESRSKYAASVNSDEGSEMPVEVVHREY